VGWSLVVTFLYKAYQVLKKADTFFHGVMTTKEAVELLMSNHLPHIQEALTLVNGNILGLREDTKNGFSNLGDDLRLIMTGMMR
jgi:hypothetical protein